MLAETIGRYLSLRPASGRLIPTGQRKRPGWHEETRILEVRQRWLQLACSDHQWVTSQIKYKFALVLEQFSGKINRFWGQCAIRPQRSNDGSQSGRQSWWRVVWNDLICSDDRRWAILATSLLMEWTNLMAALIAKLDAQHSFRMNSLSSVSLIRWRYGLSFAASDLWKSARMANNNAASKVNRSVSRDFTN